MYRPTVLLILCVLAGTAQAGRAQVPDQSPRRQLSFERLQDRQWVRVSGSGFAQAEGRVAQHSASELVLATDRRSLVFPASTVDTLWTRGNSAVAGLVVGALLGAALGIVAGTSLGEENAGSAGLLLSSGIASAVGLGLIGSAIGAAIPHWRRQFPR